MDGINDIIFSTLRRAILCFVIFFMIYSVCVCCTNGVRSNTYARETNVRLSYNNRVVTASSRMICCETCSKTDGCILASYNQVTKSCELSDKKPDGLDETLKMDADTGWNIYYRTDVDACTAKTHNCDANATCISSPAGSFTCTCNSGYTGNGLVCTGICASNWYWFDHSCYYIGTELLSWTSAMEKCALQNAHLADITSVNETNFVGLVLEASWSSDPKHYLWIGGNDLQNEGSFVWSDGTLISNGYTNWYTAGGQPDNWNDEDCMHIHPTKPYTWNDLTCNALQEYICEYEVP